MAVGLRPGVTLTATLFLLFRIGKKAGEAVSAVRSGTAARRLQGAARGLALVVGAAIVLVLAAMWWSTRGPAPIIVAIPTASVPPGPSTVDPGRRGDGAVPGPIA